MSDELSYLFKQIENFKDKIDFIQIEKNLLNLISSHNSKVDMFTRTYSKNDLQII